MQGSETGWWLAELVLVGPLDRHIHKRGGQLGKIIRSQPRAKITHGERRKGGGVSSQLMVPNKDLRGIVGYIKRREYK